MRHLRKRKHNFGRAYLAFLMNVSRRKKLSFSFLRESSQVLLGLIYFDKVCFVCMYLCIICHFIYKL